ncbi:MAG: uracil-DNA glycosylase [Lachnospiraceae bacterium]|nr:uracil-DNA glycosylase [Lachnospiraceae bacterium]MBR1913520.1 uracil-DNA glycosylase [Lachnospiraceae bacterium]
MAGLTGGWERALKEEFHKDYYKKLYSFVKSEYQSHIVYPPADKLFTALHLTPLESVRAVILGQDPYHEPGQAMGMSFSVPEGVEIPPSLKNIYKEIHEDVGEKIPDTGDLTKWAEQGVLLLNAVLTVREHEANSHKGKGWEEFTDAIIKAVDKEDRPIVFLLWGRNARDKRDIITNPGHLVLEAAHPSPLSAYNGFFGCRHFSKCNRFLRENGADEIDWGIV